MDVFNFFGYDQYSARAQQWWVFPSLTQQLPQNIFYFERLADVLSGDQMGTPMRWTLWRPQPMDLSESREPSSLISLTGIKLSMTYDPRVCVINLNEWRQDATGTFCEQVWRPPPLWFKVGHDHVGLNSPYDLAVSAPPCICSQVYGFL